VQLPFAICPLTWNFNFCWLVVTCLKLQINISTRFEMGPCNCYGAPGFTLLTLRSILGTSRVSDGDGDSLSSGTDGGSVLSVSSAVAELSPLGSGDSSSSVPACGETSSVFASSVVSALGVSASPWSTFCVSAPCSASPCANAAGIPNANELN